MSENEIHDGKLRLKKNYYETPAEPETPEKKIKPAENENPAAPPLHRRRDSSAKKRQSILILAGWLFCIALGAGLIYLRFFAVLPGPDHELLKRYGMIAVGIAYGLSIALAINDNMFDGLLAIVVPFYPLYYLFVISGSILLRAIAAALLAAFGYDCALLLQKYSLKAFDGISYWIQHV